MVRRVISRSGRGKVDINSALSTAATLGEVVARLIELAGQHEHQSLTDPAHHLDVLDGFAGLDALRDECGAAYDELREAASALADEQGDDERRAEREDFLRFQLQELDDAELRPGEETELGGERERLRAASRLTAAARRGEDVLYAGEEAAAASVAGLVRELEPLVAIDPALAPIHRQLEEARVLCEDAGEALRRYGDGVADDPDRLAAVDERLELVGSLLKKHSSGKTGTLAEVLSRREAMRAELEASERREERQKERAEALARTRKRAIAVSEKLSLARRKAAGELGKKAQPKLAALGMKGARLEVRVEPRAPREGDAPELVHEGRRLGAAGWDKVELLLSANAGEEPRPLARVASGGELSRVMLALKRVLARADAVTTYLFDEVDAGIGGGIAEVVGRELAEVARQGQVICITHLAQIGAFAGAHFLVEKRETAGRTATSVRRLAEPERAEEIARMLGGMKITAKTRAHAQEMLRAAREA